MKKEVKKNRFKYEVIKNNGSNVIKENVRKIIIERLTDEKREGKHEGENSCVLQSIDGQ